MKTHSKQYWLSLANRYFEAETTDDEERALRQFAAQTLDPDFRELQAVMGFSAVARRSAKPRVHTSRSRYRLIGVAASLVIVLGLSVFFVLNGMGPSDSGCVAWVNGVEVSDPTEVMSLMHSTMNEMNIAMQDTDPVGNQLRDMFQLIGQ